MLCSVMPLKDFAFSFITTSQRHWIKTEPLQVEPEGPFLSSKASFVGFDTADRMLLGNNPKRKDSHISVVDS